MRGLLLTPVLSRFLAQVRARVRARVLARVRPAVLSRVLVLALALAVSPAGMAAAQESPRVTTDTPEYCGSLAARIAASPAASREPSRSLAAEGVALCGKGHVRTGIAKLRRALRAAQASAAAITLQAGRAAQAPE